MGLLKAALGSAGGVLADQWKEYFECTAIDAQTLVACGNKKTSGRSSNTKGSDNIITDGSIITVADGQCMVIVEQGRVVELSAEPGAFVYNNKTEPSFFGGGIFDGLKTMFETFKTRMAFGGEAVGSQRLYYFNTKEIMGNKFGTRSPVPFRVVDNKIGLDIDVGMRCSGQYSYRITNPMLFYKNVCGNIAEPYGRANIDSTLKSEILSGIQPTFAKIADTGIRYYELAAHTIEISDAMNEILSSKWRDLRGIEVVSFNVENANISPEDEELIKNLQRTAVMRNAGMAAATLVDAQAQAMKDAANNSGGAFVGFAGMNMAQSTGGMNAQSLFDMQNQQQMQMQQQQMQMQQQQMQTQQQAPANTWKCSCGNENTGKFCNNCGSPKPEPTASNTWKCNCGTENTGKFCVNCGTPKPAPATSWKCSCGAENTGKFCNNCGKPKANFRCDKCGWKPQEGATVPKFCPECGDPFDENDLV